MRRHFHLFLGLTVATTVVAAAAADDPPEKAERDKIKGTWTFTLQEQGDTKTPIETVKDWRLIFNPEGYILKIGERVAEEGSYTLDPAKMPKVIDLKIKKGQGEGEDQLGIYKFEGETLALCFAPPGRKDRPKAFAPRGEAGPTTHFVLKREKP